MISILFILYAAIAPRAEGPVPLDLDFDLSAKGAIPLNLDLDLDLSHAIGRIL